MSRLSLRLRLTLAFALVMAIVLSVTGLVVYRVFRSELNSTIDRSLVSRSEEVAALVTQNNDSVSQSLLGISGVEDHFAQALRLDGAILAATPQVRTRKLLEGPALQRASAHGIFAEHSPVAQMDGPLRVRAVPVNGARGGVIVLVGTALGERDASLRNLAALLVVGFSVALILASLAGYGIATAALRPVEAMRKRAATMSPADSEHRLPVGTSRDEISRLGATLNAMLDRLHAAFVRERIFAADASHELRTPLGILKTEIELALRSGRSPEELRAALESAGEETDRLVRLADDLLVIASLDQASAPVHAAALDAHELLTTTAARFHARARRAGRSLRPPSGGEVRVWGDRERLEQALGNLVENAIRHASREVRLSTVVRDSVVELHVCDDGPGFASAFIGRAFERFARADGARSRGGTGLGLAIVEAIAVSHDGHAHAANLADGGADVWLELPATGQRAA